jgi:CHAT domain
MTGSPSSFDRAAELLAAYWHASPGLDPETREWCRRLAAEMERQFTASAAGALRRDPRPGVLAEAVRRAAHADLTARDLVALLAGSEPPPGGVAGGQHVSVFGKENQVLTAGSLSVHGSVFGAPAQGEPTAKADDEEPACILFLSADPWTADRLRLGEEAREIDQALRSAPRRGRIALEQRTSVRPMDLIPAILEVRPTVVHFSGHGTESGELCMEDATGRTHSVSAEALAMLFGALDGSVECVVLNACYAEIQARTIAEYVPYVVGMRKAVGDEAAIAFATGFYQALGAGCRYPQAFRLGCSAIGLSGIPGHLTPVLIAHQDAAT